LATLSFANLTAQAQTPKWAKKTAKALFTLKTFDKDGALVGSSTGFYVGERGEALSCYEPFRGAERAVVIDAEGKENPVAELLGASDTYDVAHFRVDTKKSIALDTDTTQVGATLWLQPYLGQNRLQQLTVCRMERFQDTCQYLTLEPLPRGNHTGAPLLDQEGRVVALLHPSSREDNSQCYAVSAQFGKCLMMNGLGINDPAMKATGVKKALPKAVDQALLMLYVAASQMDSVAYADLVEDFVKAFPQEPEGYMTRVRALIVQQRYDEAESQLAQAEKAVQERAEEKEFTHQNCQRLRGDMLMRQKQWLQAAEIFQNLAKGNGRSAENFLLAATCFTQMKDTTMQLALLDSAVATFSRPYLREAAPYLLTRAQARVDARIYRPAVQDYNDYEQLMARQVNDRFYYLRYQAEVEGHLFQQALNDIARAAELSPDNSFYLAEKAWLEVRVSMFDEAVVTASKCVELDPQNSDGHLFLGIALCQKGQVQEGLTHLRKAGELGNPQAETMIEQYSKLSK
jgi:tetratricopeptide (TPR) repeat protein